jgi:ABC-type branched-subunit amino acid transport system substrate-binding protein
MSVYAARHKMIYWAIGASMTGCALFPLPLTGQTAPARLRIGLITTGASTSTPASASAARGVRLGAAEAKQTAKLFGNDVELYEATAGQDPAAAAQRLLSQRQVQVIIASSPFDADTLSRFAEAHRIVFFNIASRSQRLRAVCRRFTFHIEATDAMYANASRALAKELRSRPGGTATLALDSAVLWGSSLEKYGASQINDRYRAKYRSGMDGSAWAGWAAVKIAAEAALRAASGDSPRFLAYLETPGVQFDGHKGWPLTFRAGDHQLRQPLYVVVRGTGTGSTPSETLRDVPELRTLSAPGGANEAMRASQLLDRLIATPTTPRCFLARS